jgi:diguanylate cyclase
MPIVTAYQNVRQRDIWLTAAVGLTYCLAAYVGLIFSRSAGNIATLWPPNGVLLAALLLARANLQRPLLIVGAAASMAVNLITQHGLPASLVLTLGNISEVWLAAQLMQRFGAGDDIFFRASGTVQFTLLAGLLAPACSGALVAGLLWMFNLETRAFSTWTRWFSSDALGILIITPMVMLGVIVARYGPDRIFVRRSMLEIWAILFAVAGATALVFVWRHPPILFFLFPLVLLAVFRLGPIGAAAATLVVATLGSYLLVNGYGPIADITQVDATRILFFQLFLATMFLTALPVAAILAERMTLQKALLESKQSAERAADDLYAQVTTDELTGIASRRYFLGQLAIAQDQAQRSASPVTLAMLDIDKFKTVNDSYGHPAGDEVLRQITRICRSQLRSTDIIGRLGGEEFGILMPGAGSGEARMICERLREEIANHQIQILALDATINVTVSIGLAPYNSAAVDDWYGRADTALYTAKENGRNRLHSSNY